MSQTFHSAPRCRTAYAEYFGSFCLAAARCYKCLPDRLRPGHPCGAFDFFDASCYGDALGLQRRLDNPPGVAADQDAGAMILAACFYGDHAADDDIRFFLKDLYRTRFDLEFALYAVVC